MKIKTGLIICSLACSVPCSAITCYYTLAKDSCWTNYDVSVDIISAKNRRTVATVTVPKGKQWTRQIFPCEPAEILTYIARFSPVFWQSDIGKTYSAHNYWTLPDKVNAGDAGWNVSVCYPADFSLVPLPPTATNNCRCDFSSIPVIPPKKSP